jgi:hypothetical protein
MPKVVDVILRGQLKASYPVSFAMLNSPTTEQDFIGYAALGFAYFEAVVSGWSEFRADDLERAETFAKKALALDPATTRAYHVLSQVYRLMRSMNSSSVGSLASKTTGYEATKRSCTKTSTVFFILTALSFYWSRRSARETAYRFTIVQLPHRSYRKPRRRSDR